ncbi:MAG: tetratricopeptide repeat protein [Gemmatimonadota bacterium]
MRAPRRLAPLAALLLTACLASKGDVALLQSELRSMRDASSQASVQADAAQRQRIDQILAHIAQTNDSIRALGARLAKLQGDVKNDHYEMGRQILQLQELSGQSQRRLQELRASLDERAAAAAVPATIPADTTQRPTAAPAGPGPAVLFQTSLDQLRRGSSSVARTGFEELIRNYPTSEDVPEAMVYIGETYAKERNQAAADSVYALVIQRYPESPKAATALYKRALSMKAAGQSGQARTLFDRIIREYPRSDEATLAREQLRTLK